MCTADVYLRPEHADKVYFGPTVLSLPPMLLTWPATSMEPQAPPR